MLVKTAVFIKSGTRPAHYPEDDLAEVAFAGRSNVGKSSLINTLTGRKGLVRTSSTPGRTQLINFFAVNEAFRLVDLPGYGFAQVPLAVKRQWGPMVRTYLEGRRGLKAVVLLFDIRRIPREEDLQLLDWLEAGGVPTIPVVTKVDKVGRGERERQLQAIAAETGLPPDAFTLFSAVSRAGREELWERIETALAAPPKASDEDGAAEAT